MASLERAIHGQHTHGHEEIFGLRICAISHVDAVEQIMDAVARGEKRTSVVVTPNVNHVVKINQDSEFASNYGQADYIFLDGTPLTWVSKCAGGQLKERVTGADLFPALCTRLAVIRGSAFILGGYSGEEAFIKCRIEGMYPGLVAHVYCPSVPFDPTGREACDITEKINKLQVDLVFACIGMPKQELWALAARERLNVPFVLCVGAALDFALGRLKRAPVILQRCGLEWIWRMLSEPRRLFRRYLRDLLCFVPLATKEILKRRLAIRRTYERYDG
jgi:N-acetylglucosaminyldiphosphoundecaprenol N-acetyl-beta-D-mannosaminyltransferase